MTLSDMSNVLRLPKTIFGKMLLLISGVIIVLLILATWVLVSFFEKDALRNMTETNEKYLSQMSYNATYLHQNAFNFIVTLFNDPNIVQMMYQDEIYDQRQMYNDMKRIKQLMTSNVFVDSVDVYNYKMDIFFSPGSSSITEASQFKDTELLSLLRKPQTDKRFKPIPRTIEGRDVITYIAYDLYSEESGVYGAVVVHVKSNYLQQLIAALKEKGALSEGDTYVLDGMNRIIGASESSYNRENNLFASLMESAKKLDPKHGYFVESVNGEKSLITYASSDISNWKFVHITPYKVLLHNIERMKNTVYVISLGLLLLGILTAIILSRKLYSPFGQLIVQVQQLHGKKNLPIDEILGLQRALSEIVLTQRSAVLKEKEELLRNLLNGTYRGKPERLREQATYLDLKFDPCGKCVLVGVQIDRYDEFAARLNAEDRSLIRFAVCNMLGEVLSREFKAETVVASDDCIVGFVNVDTSASDYHNKLHAALEEAQQFCRQHLQLSVTAAFGYAGHSANELDRLYAELLKLLQYRYTLGHGSIISPDSYLIRENDQYVIPLKDVQALSKLLVPGNLLEAKKQYLNTVSILGEYAYDTIVTNLNYLACSLYNETIRGRSPSAEQPSIEMTYYLRTIATRETMEEIHEVFFELMEALAPNDEPKRGSRGEQLASIAASIIEANYSDKNLCLDSIAASMGLTKLHLGKVFREHRGQSIADYITDVRIERAIALLEEGKQKLTDIFDEVGVPNQKYFYSLYKKKTGVSFRDYKLNRSLRLLDDEGAK